MNKLAFFYYAAPKLQVKLMHRAMLTLRRSQKNHPLGFTGAKLEQMCKLVNLFLNNQLLQLTLPKCGITRQHSVSTCMVCASAVAMTHLRMRIAKINVCR
jgi:hypothetical protein